jgi:AcrR family transcriptional regulator
VTATAAPVDAVGPTVDLWQRRREFVADQIERVAIDLFAQRGFAEVTVDEIAEAAGISSRTVFRYFPTKAHLVRAHQRRLHERLVRALAARPDAEGPVTALREALFATARMRPDDRERIVLVGRLLRDAGEAAPRDVGFDGDRNGELVALFVERARRARLDPGFESWPEVVVASMIAAAQAAFRAWVATSGEVDLVDLIRGALDLLDRGLAELDATDRGGSAT